MWGAHLASLSPGKSIGSAEIAVWENQTEAQKANRTENVAQRHACRPFRFTLPPNELHLPTVAENPALG